MSWVNPKCAKVSAAALGLYLVFPTRDQSGLLFHSMLILSGTYVGLSWYDAIYDCDDKNKASEWFTLYRWAKPGINAAGEYALL